MTKNLILTIVVAVLFWAVAWLMPLWIRLFGGLGIAIIFLVLTLLFVFIMVLMIIEIVKMIKHRNTITFKMILPLLIMSFILAEVWLNPLRTNLLQKYFDRNLIFTACHEGTMNTMTFRLLKNNMFEIHSTSAFFLTNLSKVVINSKATLFFYTTKTNKKPTYLTDT